jgi:hypothetical protein
MHGINIKNKTLKTQRYKTNKKYLIFFETHKKPVLLEIGGHR